MRSINALTFAALSCISSTVFAASDDGRRWLAGDHHVHSEWSVDWDRTTTPPTPIRGGDSSYTRSRNARQALAHGLSWMVHTDHGGPGHSKVTRDNAWPALEQARRDVPSLVQFHGMEFDVPGGEHASLIIAPGPDERAQQFEIERDYSRNEPLQDGMREDGALMSAALKRMRTMSPQPLVFINHPSRTATGVGEFGDVEPAELRQWHDAAPNVLVGMEGAPGHQATRVHRGLYRNAGAPTFGGFDQMTAIVGGVWDTLLASGRRFWITATSDSHVNLRDGGRDFDPGEYSKTYVLARPDAEDLLDGMREGRMFAVTGDLIDALELTVRSTRGPSRSASMGGALQVSDGEVLQVDLRVRQRARPNASGEQPSLDHVELIFGETVHDAPPRMTVKRIGAGDLKREGEWLATSWKVEAPPQGGFVRVRGTNSSDVAPSADVAGEDPWKDLWFYSNPVFLQAR